MIPGFDGRVVARGDPDYDELRRVRNARIDRRPYAIARCTHAGDAAVAVRWARERGIPVTARGAGTHVAGWATCDGGLVVDLGDLRDVTVDPGSRTAVAEAGLTWGELDAATGRVGLALPGPRNADVGIAGHTLGGGIGDLSRLYGLTCDNVASMDVVTAEGEQLVVDADRHPDLFWALRGGSGHFAVVTAFTYRLHPVASVVAGPLVFTADRAFAVLRRVRDWLAGAPDAASVVALAWTAPPVDLIPADLHYERCLVLVPTWFGPPEHADAVLGPLRTDAVSDGVRRTSYVQHQRTLPSPPNPRSQHVYNRGELLDDLADTTIDSLVGQWRAAGPNLSVVFGALGGAIARCPAGPTAFGHREARWFVEIAAQWYGAPNSEPHLAPARAAWRSLQPVSRGPYVNLLPDSGQQWARRVWGDGLLERLSRVKRIWDPHDVFRFGIGVSAGATDVTGGHG